MRKQSGFTLPELLFVIFGIFCVALAAGALVVGIHFITKFW